MSVILNGVPEPRIQLVHEGVVVDDFTLSGFEGGTDGTFLVFEPAFIRHELQNGSVVSRLRGFRMRCELYWPAIDGESLQKVRRLLDRRAYDTVWLYPWATDKPFYREQVTIDDDSLNLAYFYLLKQRDFTLKLISARLLDYVPLEDADFRTWGNVTLQFFDLDVTFASYRVKVELATINASEGDAVMSTAGYYFDGSTEGIRYTTGADGFIWVDRGQTVMFEVTEEALGEFVQWLIDDIPAGTSQVLVLAIEQNTMVKAQFT